MIDACKAEGISLSQTCNLTFNNDHELVAVGKVTKGSMKPQPGIAGVGIWFAMMVFFGTIIIAFTFVILETLSRSTAP